MQRHGIRGGLVGVAVVAGGNGGAFRARASADAITLSAKFFTTIIFHYHD